MRRPITRVRLHWPIVLAAALLPTTLVGLAGAGADAVAPTSSTHGSVAGRAASPIRVGAVSLAPRVRSMPVAGELTSTAVNTSSISIPVPSGVTPTAITAVVTQPDVVAGGSVAFSVNGAPALSAASSLYQKVRIPVTAANVTADGGIGLSFASQGAAVAGLTCVPTSGTAAVRKIALEYTGTETAPTSVGDFFGAAAASVDVVIPADASQSTIEAGLTAVDALARRYDDKTPVELTTSAPDPASAVASQRVVSLVAGRAGEVTTAVTADGAPTLTLTGTGDELVDAARSLSSDALLLGGGQDQDPSTQMKSRSTPSTLTLSQLDVASLSLQGYGSTTQQIRVKQDQFGSPVDSLTLHLAGTHTAFAADAGARLDVRANGALVGSKTLGTESGLDTDITIPASRLQSVNDIDLTLVVPPPGGAACAAPGTSGAEVDIDVGSSSVHATRGTGRAEGFQLYPQVFEGTLPIAINATGKQRIQSAIDAADLVVALQRAAAAQLDIQVVPPATFLADDRSGLITGAVAQDSVNLDAPLRLSSTRRLDRADSRFAVTSQDPYAVLESIDRNSRFVLMLGSWAPGDGPASGKLTRKVTDDVVSQEWSSLSGDLVLADDTTPAFTAASRSLKPHTTQTTQRSYAGWFVAAIVVLLLLLAFQVLNSRRRSRSAARARAEAEADERRHGPAYVEDAESPAAADGLGDLDDLEVTSGIGSTTNPGPQPGQGTPRSSTPTTPPVARRSRLRRLRAAEPASDPEPGTATPSPRRSSPGRPGPEQRSTGTQGSSAQQRSASQQKGSTARKKPGNPSKPRGKR